MRNSELKITSAEVSVVQYMVDISSSYEGSSISVIPINDLSIQEQKADVYRYNLKKQLNKKKKFKKDEDTCEGVCFAVVV